MASISGIQGFLLPDFVNPGNSGNTSSIAGLHGNTYDAAAIRQNFDFIDGDGDGQLRDTDADGSASGGDRINVGGGNVAVDSLQRVTVRITFDDGSTFESVNNFRGYLLTTGQVVLNPMDSTVNHPDMLPFARWDTLTIINSSPNTISNTNMSLQDDPLPVCFAGDALIETSSGPIRAREIAPGDLVVTRDHGLQRVTWAGRSEVGGHVFRANPKLRPVRIAAGALGNGLPTRDLLVSRQHRMLLSSRVAERMFGVPEVFVAAIKLTVLPGIDVDETVESIDYVHLLFDDHQIVYAEGAPAESLLVGSEALKAVGAEARAEIFALFPELRGPEDGLAPARQIPEGARQKQLVARHKKNSVAPLALWGGAPMQEAGRASLGRSQP